MFDKTALMEWFEESDVPHGTLFDNGHRWCGICNATRPMRSFSEKEPWADKTCLECSAVWPEYMQLMIAHVMEDDMDESLDTAYIN
jgi:hypothetical protein